jgi:hypothetical protein
MYVSSSPLPVFSTRLRNPDASNTPAWVVLDMNSNLITGSVWDGGKFEGVKHVAMLRPSTLSAVSADFDRLLGDWALHKSATVAVAHLEVSLSGYFRNHPIYQQVTLVYDSPVLLSTIEYIPSCFPIETA